VSNPMHDAPALVTSDTAHLGDSVLEYGIQRGDRPVEWPDGDNELYIGAEFVDATDLSALVQAARRHEPGSIIVERGYTVARSEVPLPTTPGSLIRATVDGERILALRTADPDEFPWKRANGDGHGWYSAGEFSDVEILHEEAAK
jgi:hypothetical protein